MPASSKRRSNAPNPDFKRVKNKVGKRAPKQVNATDTSFRAASINVRKQAAVGSLEPANAGGLFSARGRSLQELATQLQHPAAAVRVSATKGLKDLVVGPQMNFDVIQAHLPTLVPAVGKCCVDEDDEVRQLGSKFLQEILHKLNKGSQDGSANALRPFVPLLVAFVSSALNSLDRSTRQDGAATVEFLFSSVPELVEPHVPDLLPAFVRLFSDRTFRKQTSGDAASTGSSAKAGSPQKRWRPQSSRTNKPSGQQLLLQSLVSVLESANKYERALEQSAQSTMLKADMTFLPGGRSRNALILEGWTTRSRKYCRIKGLYDVPSFEQLDGTSAHISGYHVAAARTISPKTACGLLEKLRDVCIETTQNGHHDKHEGFRLPEQDVNMIVLLARALRLFWEAYGEDLSLQRGGVSEKDWLDIRKVCQNLISLIQETFPLSDSEATLSVVEGNGELCVVLVKMMSIQESVKEKDSSIAKVVHYLQSSLEEIQELKAGNVSSKSTTASRSVFEVFEELFLRYDELTCDPKTKVRIIGTFCATFFPEGGPDLSLARSAVGRKAILLADRLLRLFHYSVTQATEKLGPAISKAVNGSAEYLTAWGGDFPEESATVISLLHNVIRRIEVGSNGSLDSLRTRLECVVTPSEEKSKTRSSGCLFELFSPELQRRFVALIVMLESPTATTLRGLSKVCARCHSSDDETTISSDIASFIVNSIHTIRKTIPMQSFMTFLIDSTGVLSVDEATLALNEQMAGDSDEQRLNWSKMLEFDHRIRETSCCLVYCGTLKVLPMLHPLLAVLMEKREANEITNREVLQLRMAFSLLAMFSLDLTNRDECASVFAVLPDLSHTKVIEAACRFFQHAPTSQEAEEAVVGSWLRPFLPLLDSESSMLQDIFALVVSDIDSLDEVTLGRVLTHLLSMIKNPVLAHRVQKSGQDMMIFSKAKMLVTALAGGPFEQVAGRILAELNVRTVQCSNNACL